MYPFSNSPSIEIIDDALLAVKTELEADATLADMVDAISAYSSVVDQPESTDSYVFVIVRRPIAPMPMTSLSARRADRLEVLVETNDASPEDRPQLRLELVHRRIADVLRGVDVGGLLPLSLYSNPSVPQWDDRERVFFSVATYLVVL